MRGNGKLVIAGVAGAALLLMGWRAYSRIRAGAAAVASIPEMAKEVASAAWTDIKGAVSNLAGSMDSTPFGPIGPSSVPFSQWSANVKAQINALNKMRGINREWTSQGDFSGWKVFSNGSIISPDGFVFQSRNPVTNDFSTVFNPDGTPSIDMVEIGNGTGNPWESGRYQWQIPDGKSVPENLDPFQFG